jgi:hypothetical protein
VETVGGSSRTCDFYDHQRIAAGYVPIELLGPDTERLQRLPADDYWLCEESDF